MFFGCFFFFSSHGEDLHIYTYKYIGAQITSVLICPSASFPPLPRLCLPLKALAVEGAARRGLPDWVTTQNQGAAGNEGLGLEPSLR